MLYLLLTFWLWLLLALASGLGLGWWSARRDEPGRRRFWPWGLVLALGSGVAFLQWLPGRLGFWLDLGLLIGGAFLLGCVIASRLRWQRTPATRSDAGLAGSLAPATASGPKERAVEPGAPIIESAVVAVLEEAITGLSTPRDGKSDDLSAIYGIDAEIAGKLNALGLYHYDQLAVLTPGQRRWLFARLGYAGRFPSWWWRWRYDAEQLAAQAAQPKTKAAARPKTPPVPEAAAVSSLAAPAAGTDAGVEDGARPEGLSAPRAGKADDLKRIRGIGKQNEGRLHGLGIWHFDQIAGWSADEIAWVGAYLAFPGRIEREGWAEQARVLAAGGVTEFAQRADAGEVANSRDETGDDGQGNVITLAGLPRKPGVKPRKT